MSAFAVVFERSANPVNPDALGRAVSQLQHRGPDGYDESIAEHVAMGHWHFWTTPEEVGEKQPLEADSPPLRIVFDGRLDNRSELLNRLGLTESSSSLSDAGLVSHSYIRWGEHCVENFLGEFALVIWDGSRNQLFCARDALGERTLFYSCHGTSVVIASEAWAVAVAGASQPAINDATVAHYFAMRATEDGQTVFKSVTELLPAHALIITESNERSWRYWEPASSIRLAAQSDEECAEQFLFILQESIRCRLRSAVPVGVLMSGGLDSTSIACLAVSLLSPQPLKTISYVFDELAECDERQYINAVRDRLGLCSVQIAGDDAWTLMDLDHWPHNPSEHEGNPFRLLKERSYRRAQQEGIRVLLTGSFGDDLYAAGWDWLFELVMDGRIREASRELFSHVRQFGVKRVMGSRFMSRALRRSLDAIPGGARIHRPQALPAWQTSFTAAALADKEPNFNRASQLKSALVSSTSAHNETLEIFNGSRYSLELRLPYRDRRLVEFVWSLPAYHLYSRGIHKHILRIAMRGSLPELVRLRPGQTSLAPLFYRGLEREKENLRDYLAKSDGVWKLFVQADWVFSRLNAGSDPSGPSPMIPWLCASYQKWHSLVNQQRR